MLVGSAAEITGGKTCISEQSLLYLLNNLFEIAIVLNHCKLKHCLTDIVKIVRNSPKTPVARI